MKIGEVTLIFSPLQGIETASLGVFIKSGARFERKSVKGIAHFLEHVLFKGSRHYTYQQIKREIEGRGGSLNGFTSQEITAFYARFLNKNLHPTVDILLDMINSPLFPKEEIEKERKVVLEEIKMYNDLPSSRAMSLLDKLLFKGHPLGDEVVGVSSSVKSIKRKDLFYFKNKYYVPAHMVISCSGDFRKEKLISSIKKYIVASSQRTKLRNTAPGPLRGMRCAVERRNLQQTHLCLGFRGLSYQHSLRFVIELINVVLGANMSSRLFEAIREKRALCYEISTEARKYSDSGAFIIHLGLDNKNVPVALRTILRELKKIKEKKITLSELGRAKDYFLGQIAMALERPEGKMFFLAERYLTLGRIPTLSQIKKDIAQITPYDVKHLTEKIFNFSHMGISCVGDIEEVEMKKKIKEVARKA